MGTIQHDAVIAVLWERHNREAFTEWRATLPAAWQRLAVGPVDSIVNGDTTYVWLPDGSKEYWATSDEGDEYRAQFVALVQSLGHYPRIVGVSFGELGDHVTDLADGVPAEPPKPERSAAAGQPEPTEGTET